jgi:medium-chain acyl-[acyl-carrier-protein] hydrolase
MITLPTPTARSAWTVIPRPLLAPRFRLICLPHAGAGASVYHGWAPLLEQANIELCAVQYPGRERRIQESVVTSAERMIAMLVEQWPALTGGQPSMLFGHSMGALLSYELTLELARRGETLPQHLFLSGRNPPHSVRSMPDVHRLPDAEFVRAIAGRYGALPQALLDDPEMRQMVISILRGDLELVDTHRWSSEAVGVPLTIFGGTSDPWTSRDELHQWQQYASRGSNVQWFPGDHFFHQKCARLVITAIEQTLDSRRLVSV